MFSIPKWRGQQQQRLQCVAIAQSLHKSLKGEKELKPHQKKTNGSAAVIVIPLLNLLKEAPDVLIVDKVDRAICLLNHSYQIDAEEALNAMSFIKPGIDLSRIEGLSDQEVNKIFFELRRGHLSLAIQEELSQEILAQKRAEYLQSALKPLVIKL